MTQPNRMNGMTEDERIQMCQRKQRFSDELTANAGAMISLERHDQGYSKLWTYKCPVCKGWHLTKKPVSGKEPIRKLIMEEA